MSDRRQYLQAMKQMGTATAAELAELREMPVFVGDGNVMVVPARAESVDEFMKLQSMDGAAEQPAPVTPDPIRQQAEEMAQQVCERVAPVAELINSIIDAHRPAEQQASKADESQPDLGPHYKIVASLPDGSIRAMFADPSLPRSPAREVIIDAKQLRKIETANMHHRAQLSRGPRARKPGAGRRVSF